MPLVILPVIPLRQSSMDAEQYCQDLDVFETPHSLFSTYCFEYTLASNVFELDSWFICFFGSYFDPDTPYLLYHRSFLDFLCFLACINRALCI